MTARPPTLPPALETEEAKEHLRAAIRKARLHRSERKRVAAATALTEHVLAMPTVQHASTVSVYASRATEPRTLDLIQSLHERGVAVLIPMLGDGLQRGWGFYQSAEDLTERAPGRPPEPSGPFLAAAALRDADLVIVPALAVDTSGTRLGQGGGWYDRALAEAHPKAPVVALVFEDELYDAAQHALPREAHDYVVQAVITPDGITKLPA